MYGDDDVGDVGDPRGLSNKNTSWMNEKFWLFYTFVVFAFRTILYVVPVVPQMYAWSVIHIVSSSAFLYFFHWVKGQPFWGDGEQGLYDHLTFWEQLDGGVQYTSNRKFLTLAPIFIFLMASYDIQWSHRMSYVNVFFLFLAVFPKVGCMHRHRIAGIND